MYLLQEWLFASSKMFRELSPHQRAANTSSVLKSQVASPKLDRSLSLICYFGSRTRNLHILMLLLRVWHMTLEIRKSSSGINSIMLDQQKDSTLRFLEEEFNNWDWLLVPQPSSLPSTNVLDEYVFVMLSRHLFIEQALLKAGYSFAPEELWIAIHKVFKEMLLDALV